MRFTKETFPEPGPDGFDMRSFSRGRAFFALAAAVAAAFAISACRSYKGFTPREVEKKAQEYSEEAEAPAVVDPNVAYLEENAKKEEVIVRPSGLQIRVIRKGEGRFPSAHSEVTAHYEGKLIDGTVFDSTRTGGEPFTFTMDSVIKGWREALTLMREGSVFELVIPANLAYGTRGAQGTIPPGATLIFEVELVSLTRPLEVKSALDH
ncbi:MAG TPA: FKBP-type peptidyl-prolyl cis-trans isomerase [Sphingomonadales bacterium]|nr:FKBP-type peptidyl-prolyl cis-trans isomerase [Sphingomonadales bacterium]